MDLGVGSFVFSQGVVSAIPLIKDPYHLKAPFLRKIIRVMSNSLPVIVLGLIRVLLVKGTDYPVSLLLTCPIFQLNEIYQEHVTEYGVHWNFFITLALLPVMQTFIHPIFQQVTISIVGFGLAIREPLTASSFVMTLK
jgi:phosphatidylinositol glycan class W